MAALCVSGGGHGEEEMSWGGGGKRRVLPSSLGDSLLDLMHKEDLGRFGTGVMMKVVLSDIISGPFQLGNTDSKCRATWGEAAGRETCQV